MKKRSALILALFSTALLGGTIAPTPIFYNAELTDILGRYSQRIGEMEFSGNRDTFLGVSELVAASTVYLYGRKAVNSSGRKWLVNAATIALAAKGVADVSRSDLKAKAEIDKTLTEIQGSRSFLMMKRKLDRYNESTFSFQRLQADLLDDITQGLDLEKSIQERCKTFAGRREREYDGFADDKRNKGKVNPFHKVTAMECEKEVLACLTTIPEMPGAPSSASHAAGAHSGSADKAKAEPKPASATAKPPTDGNHS